MIFNAYMPGESGCIRHNDMISYNAIMGHMAVSHKKIIISDNGDPVTSPGPTVQSDKFPEDIIAADFQVGGFSFVFEILRISADGTVAVKAASFSDGGPAGYIDMGIQNAARSYASVWTYNAIGPNLGLRGYLAGFVYYCSRVYGHGK